MAQQHDGGQQPPGHLSDAQARLWRSAAATLQGNWTGRSTVPSGTQYPHQWSWDSAFISIGWSAVQPSRARTELEALLAGQWADGRLPHIQFNPAVPEEAYFPGPAFWASKDHPDGPAVPTSGLIQPPVHARAVLAAVTAALDTGGAQRQIGLDFGLASYPRLLAWHRYLHERRDVAGDGLVAVLHPWESGLDNSPVWDTPLAAVSRDAAPAFTRRDTAHVGAAERPTDRDYAAYVALAAAYRDGGYDDTTAGRLEFVVADPLVNAVLLDAELCLARLAGLLGIDGTPHTRAAEQLHEAMLATLYDPERGVYVSRDLRTGQPLTAATLTGLLPLLDPWLTEPIRDRLLDRLASPGFLGGARFPVPSTALDAAEFDRRRYWRGPTWISTNWLLALGALTAGRSDLAERIATAGLDLVAGAGFREYFDPLDGAGLGAHEFSWSAALSLDWLAHPVAAAERA